MAKDLMTTQAAADLTSYTADYIRELAREGKIEGQKWGEVWQVSKSSLLAYVRKTEKLGAKRGRKPKA